MGKNNSFEAWHFLANDRKLQYVDKTFITPGLKLSVDKERLNLCSFGLHASKRAIDALQYAPGGIICRVLVSGAILEANDKVCASQREVLWMADATNELHEFGCWAAEQALYLMRSRNQEPDKRSWAAIQAKRDWIAGKISNSDLTAARAAAWAAARAAAWAAARAAAGDAAGAAARAAAGDAAGAAARAAAGDAARAAAGDAAGAAAGAAARAAARDAAWAAAGDAQNSHLEFLLCSITKRIN